MINGVPPFDLGNTPIRCWVNGELRQHGNTELLMFDVPTLIESISAGITLCPGDIIATGTPADVGAEFDPPRFLKFGDRVRIEIPDRSIGKSGAGAQWLSSKIILRRQPAVDVGDFLRKLACSRARSVMPAK